MNEMIDRYLDGDLSEEQARTFLADLAREPELEADLRAVERAQVLASRPLRDRPGPGFADAVMDRIAAGDVRPQDVRVRQAGTATGMPSATGWAMAAVIVLAFGLGIALSQLGMPWIARNAAGPDRALVRGPEGDGVAPELKMVRLVHVPGGDSPAEVAVAGTFNDWNPVRTPMREEDGVWTAVLLLPPGTYEYMFVEDGERWVTDRLAAQTQDDGFGRENAILDLSI